MIMNIIWIIFILFILRYIAIAICRGILIAKGFRVDTFKSSFDMFDIVGLMSFGAIVTKSIMGGQ